MVRTALALGALVLGLALAGCGGSSSGGKAAAGGGGGQTVTIKESEYKLDPAKVTISKPGSVTFVVQNMGKIGHALEVEGNGVEQKTATIDPGMSAKLTVDLSKAGGYEVYCPIDGHRKLGMEASAAVGGGGAGGGTTTEKQQTTTSGGYGY